MLSYPPVSASNCTGTIEDKRYKLHLLLNNVIVGIHRSSRYLVVKLLRAQGEFDNIDVEYVGAHGWSGRCLCPCSMAVLN